MGRKSETATTCDKDGARYPSRGAKTSDHPNFWAPFWRPKSIKILIKFVFVFYIRFGTRFFTLGVDFGAVLGWFWDQKLINNGFTRGCHFQSHFYSFFCICWHVFCIIAFHEKVDFVLYFPIRNRCWPSVKSDEFALFFCHISFDFCYPKSTKNQLKWSKKAIQKEHRI